MTPTSSALLDGIRDLTAADVRARLDALDDERRALMVLWRSLAARERAAARRRAAKPEEVRRAD